ncbi:hypothetical protein LTR08_002681 [Meristemomyces frigidus]|nr:hypothetical protein LTR08_002681 [Meristemomyces frigidus]
MSQTLRLAVSQSRTLPTTKATLDSLASTTREAASKGVDLILFPEAFLGGYPRTCGFGATVGSRTDDGREQFLQYFRSCIDLGDTPLGAGDAWVDRKLPVARGEKYRGDGTREHLEQLAKETGVFVITGLVEKAGGSLYCSVLYICPHLGCIGKRRKVMPTGSERLVWAQGSPSTLRAVTTRIKGVRLTMAAAICWENMMPLLRYALYSQNVNLWLAPTADARDSWWPLMRTVGNEGRCFVLSAISCVKRKNLPEWIEGVKGSATATGSQQPKDELVSPPTEANATAASGSDIISDGDMSTKNRSSPAPYRATPASPGEDFVCRGGSCIVGPMGNSICDPLWEVEDGGLLITEADFEDCERGRLDLDVAGSYSRNDSFRLSVEGLCLDPPA